MLQGILSGLGESSDIGDVVDRKLMLELGLTQRIACGGEGCVYLTTRGTAVKIQPDCAAVDGPLNEVFITRYLQSLYGKHPCIPLIHRVGRVKNQQCCYASFVEREALNSAIIEEEYRRFFTYGTPIFADLTDSKVSAQTWKERLAMAERELPPHERGLALQMLAGLKWLHAQHIYPGDMEKLANWGVRADGTLVARDLGWLTLTYNAPAALRSKYDPYEAGERTNENLEQQYAAIEVVNPELKTSCETPDDGLRVMT